MKINEQMPHEWLDMDVKHTIYRKARSVCESLKLDYDDFDNAAHTLDVLLHIIDLAQKFRMQEKKEEEANVPQD